MKFEMRPTSVGYNSLAHCAADKLDNVGSILADYGSLGDALWGLFNGGKDGTLWHYRAVVETLRVHQTPLTEELDRVVFQLETLAARSVKDSE
jgi:hypothetical protein